MQQLLFFKNFNFYVNLNNFFFFFVFFFILFLFIFIYYIKTLYLNNNSFFLKKIENITYNFLISFVFFILVCWVFFKPHQNELYFLTNNVDKLNTVYYSNFVFFFLFLLITPITFLLLIRHEKLTTIFCSINFLILLTIVLFLITTNDLLGLIIGYELLFLPAFLIMRKTVYSAAAQSAYSVFTVWSVLGSMLVVSGGLFVLIKNQATSLNTLNNAYWSESELFLVSFLFFIGFGVKIPMWPFHYWLTRVHVEASTGFSIFLSGFLVKAAVFVCWKIIWSLGLQYNNPIFMCLCFFSIVDSVLKLSSQTDIKKLVAFATVFEMGLIYLFLLWKPNQAYVYVFLFSFSHAFLSGLMFYLVEVIYNRTHTRNLDSISGLAALFPKLSKSVWFMLFIFWGLPLTLKFFVEFWILLSIYLTNSVFLFFFIISLLLLANISVTRSWLYLLYGSLQQKYNNTDLSFFEINVIFYFIFLNLITIFIF